jgi:hypothetical protein
MHPLDVFVLKHTSASLPNNWRLWPISLRTKDANFFCDSKRQKGRAPDGWAAGRHFAICGF